MKNTTIKILIIFTTLIGTATAAVAQNLEAKPFDLLMQQIESSRFTYRERALVHGFYSIQSCLYTSTEIVVLKNYCYPKKNYPAKGYTIFSRKFGIIDLYQEQLGDILKRDVSITVFPDALHQQMTAPMTSYRIRSLNTILEHFYRIRGPACWSTNFSRYTEAPDVACNISKTDVSGFAEWSDETQRLTASQADWSRLIGRLERIFSR